LIPYIKLLGWSKNIFILKTQSGPAISLFYFPTRTSHNATPSSSPLPKSSIFWSTLPSSFPRRRSSRAARAHAARSLLPQYRVRLFLSSSASAYASSATPPPAACRGSWIPCLVSLAMLFSQEDLGAAQGGGGGLNSVYRAC
jgi:hypothetical protein